MTVRVRFAPSPTGNVHIGNLRAAIFNWLFARHEQGQFLLRIEDTDVERSTPEAISTLLEAMDWLGLISDEEPLYQSSQRARHLQAAEQLLAQGDAYRAAKGGGEEATLFRLPWAAEGVPGVCEVGPAEITVHPDEPVFVQRGGVAYSGISRKGKPIPSGGCLAGFRDLEIIDAAGATIFCLDEKFQTVQDGESFAVEGGVRLRFTRREVRCLDLVKGALAKPLDSIKDFVIVRSDGSPVFHLANVCDDISQNITHIIRGDDHVENTYRHIFLFAALGATPPHYGHLPMIVNASGKPYSKRDGDAFVGDFRAKGFLPEALFNYLTLLGWSPGDDREKMTREEIAAAFTLERVQLSAAQMDERKLLNLNGQYMAAMPFDDFLAACREALKALAWAEATEEAKVVEVAELMQSRTKLIADIAAWEHFFVDLPVYDEKAVRKFLCKPGIGDALQALAEQLESLDFADLDALEASVVAVTEAAGIRPGKLNQPLRIAVTGSTIGAGIYETLAVLGRNKALQRLTHACNLCEQQPKIQDSEF